MLSVTGQRPRRAPRRRCAEAVRRSADRPAPASGPACRPGRGGAPGTAFSTGHRVGHPRPGRELGEEAAREPARLLERHVLCEPDDRVRARKCAPERAHVRFADRLYRRERPLRAAPVGVPAEDVLPARRCAARGRCPASRGSPAAVVSRFRRSSSSSGNVGVPRRRPNRSTNASTFRPITCPWTDSDESRADRSKTPPEPIDRETSIACALPLLSHPAPEHPPGDPRGPSFPSGSKADPLRNADDDRDERAARGASGRSAGPRLRPGSRARSRAWGARGS